MKEKNGNSKILKSKKKDEECLVEKKEKWISFLIG
jgi:hypothetical protein